MARTPGQAARRDPDWEGVRLHVVSGKGGTGKTTLAAALALALAADGGRVLLIEVEGRQGIAELFGIAALPYEERRIASVSPSQLGLPAGEVPAGGARAGEVLALAIDTEQALLEYLEMFYKLGRAGKALQKVGFVDFATTIAPGVRDVLLTGKACEAARRKGPDGRRRYDAVVMDAPPTGRITRFLNVNSEVAGLARIGPIHTQAQAVMRVLRSPETAVHLVTLLEEMPVQETVDGIAELREAKLPVGGVMVNMVRPPVLDAAAVAAVDGDHREEVALALGEAGLGGRSRRTETVRAAVEPLLDPLLEQAREHAERVELEREQRADLQQLRLPTYELPLLGEGVDLGGLYRLAGELKRQGAA
ncbi:ArsA-related P-loop ATPase [Kitasatospora aureofaciens]|uniref:ATPase n=1 Tax=Kitasatospora aureofaciens TaxID=1894 RepID=A0A1E7NBR5_KITAU|nr:ArsA-related P-loop ATPase [Kitasatospora aureofaciens]QEV00853.1 ATPase [Streptomyces viridifaciens]ARF79644.1 ATPase [Kitasatospora aureofaciens]OEV38146.1 ATPase [Kitasatospora aureofaciens]UKZ07167.1 P-loop NTPase [Streptomyces viridifaciens]GGU64576.1 ATPase [Kitasatospora aureofaciens]